MLYGLCMHFEKLTEKKALLDQHRPLPPELLQNLEQWFLVELTYTSNAIEGNTLTRRETAVVVEKGLTVSGKSLVEHLEATNHAAALRGIMELVSVKTSDLSESTVLDIHNTILRGIDDGNAEHYRSVPVRISGSEVILPNPRKVPDLMAHFIENITTESNLHPVELAAEAHYQLVTIHPFVDGNGRTARLLMNLILMQHGFPPALIRKRDRLRYIGSLEKAQLGGSKDAYYKIIAAAVDRSLDIYLKALSDSPDGVSKTTTSQLLMRIGQLAKATGESNATLRYWTKEGLLEVADVTEAGYQLYAPEMVDKVACIRDLQAQRFTIKEIKAKLAGE
jgi:Fic family protein